MTSRALGAATSGTAAAHLLIDVTGDALSATAGQAALSALLVVLATGNATTTGTATTERLLSPYAGWGIPIA